MDASLHDDRGVGPIINNTPTNKKILNLESRNAEIASVKEVLFRGTSSPFYLDGSPQLCQTLISPYDAHICVGGTVCRYQTHNVETEAALELCKPKFYSSKCLIRALKCQLMAKIIITSCNFFITNITSDLTHTENVYFQMD